jgi:voltage-dependent potassium channel beta subunit
MLYRRMGRSGLQLSVLSFGSWVSFDNQLNDDAALECLDAAHAAGCNFFDNAESYAGGESERIMGRALTRLGWARETFVVSSKFFWGIHGSVPNLQNTLNRKYLTQAVDRSLERFGLDFLDLIYCHRPDPNTPVEETVWAMSDIVSSGKALYWGTSEWPADDIRAAWEIAERHHLHKPVVEQPQYNLLERRKVEVEYARLYAEIGLGTTIWSPLASGLLTGKYRDGIPAGSRAALEGYQWLAESLTDPERVGRVENLRPIAERFGASMAQLAIAWCATNPNVSTVITGASRASQVVENFAALDLIEQLTPDVLEEIDAALSGSGASTR